MAGTAAPKTTDDGWTTTHEPFGKDVDFGTDNKGEFVGTFLGSKQIEVPDEAERKRTEGDPQAMRAQMVYDFADSNGEKRAVWGSWAVDKGMTDIPVGHLVRILGKGLNEASVGTVKLYEIAHKAQ